MKFISQKLNKVLELFLKFIRDKLFMMKHDKLLVSF